MLKSPDDKSSDETPQTGKPELSETLSYAQAKSLLEQDQETSLQELAVRGDVQPEVLYYLAESGSPMVRQVVAGNPSTPVQADRILAEDDDDEVRVELARKIGRLVPDMPEDDRDQLRELTIEVLEILAQDQLPKVRQIIAEEIKSATNVPPKVVRKLARDLELAVCAPILEYSPLLNDDDLKEIIAAGSVHGALTSIARRPHVSETVSDALSATLDIPAVSALLANPNAQIREETLDAIIDGAGEIEAWHSPLAMRQSLSLRAMKRIAGFVASQLINHMIDANDLPDETAEELLDRVRLRLEAETVGDEEERKLAEKAAQMHRRGEITDGAILNMIQLSQRELLLHCLAAQASLPLKDVRKMMLSKSGRAVTALAWTAGLAMRTAFELQKQVALVPPAQLVPAKDGLHYPLSDAELEWQITAFTEAA